MSVFSAVKTGDLECIRRKVKRNEAVSNKVNKKGESLLLCAAKYGQLEACSLLLESGADANLASADGDTPLLVATEYGRYDICELLLSGGANASAENSYEATPLICAAKRGHRGICQLLLKLGLDVNKGTALGNTALKAAAVHGHARVTELLIERGADVNDACGESKYTALMLAGENGHTDVCEALLSQGADIEHRDTFGRSVLRVAKEKGRDETFAFLEREMNNEFRRLKRELEEARAELDGVKRTKTTKAAKTINLETAPEMAPASQ
ncbi:hypothetical protein SARC_02395 [Sphaeroforma arctica JP610]|uniref:Uncharacterized protein n=1 Tax=Sphaeroforma arctica JP610 TaxID=667725 RepID=A0A0L0G8W6_9EUKA|nr:hypothetical protein SARC_02395 [Sphaeroforma arctica JP610]KNC85445.1 hypothetical protein SARC_02395 [Sphaeroforma arctica JP610]|eukprot:XP_014159347.1 hypothetical protein SARC_02395 [Sphaeroforma arctica JP610]